MTQQNAALVEQSAAAAEHLSHQAQALIGIVARFRIETSRQGRSRPPAPVPTRPLPPYIARHHGR